MEEAEEFLDKKGINPLTMVVPSWKDLRAVMLSELLESYHQSKINAITDADIEEKGKHFKDSINFRHFRHGIKWFKEKLKQ